MNRKPIPEWAEQSAVQLTWPHEGTDWDYCMEDVVETFRRIAEAVLKFEPLIVTCEDVGKVREQLSGIEGGEKIRYYEVPSNDTWARDHNALCIEKDGRMHLLKFVFNGWGMKFAANKDNQIPYHLYRQGAFAEGIEMEELPIVLEGGSVEFDERGTLLTTANCIFSLNRNLPIDEDKIVANLKDAFGFRNIHILRHGDLMGDDTDSHIDTLARLCPNDTIAYVRCDDETDPHYEELRKMEEEIKALRIPETDEPYRLVPLPMPDAIYEDGERLPATYANFLIVNGGVIVPIYCQSKDTEAMDALREAFPDREIVPVDCRTLIRQHGSLHCVTMQYPKGVAKV